MKNGWSREEWDTNATSFQTEEIHLQMCCLAF